MVIPLWTERAFGLKAFSGKFFPQHGARYCGRTIVMKMVFPFFIFWVVSCFVFVAALKGTTNNNKIKKGRRELVIDIRADH